MGRVVKNPHQSDEKYVVAPPNAGGNGRAPDDVLYSDSSLGSSEPEPVFPESEPQRAIDWDALHKEAADLLDSAAVDAESLLTQARDHVRTIMESAQSGANQIAEKAHTDGRQDGYREGVSAAETEMEEMLATMRGLIDMARVERHKIVESAEPEIVRLAMGIAERILHKAVEIDREVVIAITKAAIGELVDRESITVRVNPIDLERMKQHRDSMLALGETRHMRVIEDQRVDPGGVVVETDAGSLDAKISTQVEEAKRVLKLDTGEFLLEPSPESPLRSNGSSVTAATTAAG